MNTGSLSELATLAKSSTVLRLPMAIARNDFDNGVVEILGTARYSVSLAKFRSAIESVTGS